VLRRRGAGRSHEIDAGRAVRWLLERAEAATEERVAAARANPAADQARTRKLAAEARLAELNAAEREGELVPADQVGDRWGRMVLALREAILALPAVAVQRGLAMPEHEVALAELAHDALAELAARGKTA
jgi:phage terminase Nu1 subunit (DNA packaging protein)